MLLKIVSQREPAERCWADGDRRNLALTVINWPENLHLYSSPRPFAHFSPARQLTAHKYYPRRRNQSLPDPIYPLFPGIISRHDFKLNYWTKLSHPQKVEVCHSWVAPLSRLDNCGLAETEEGRVTLIIQEEAWNKFNVPSFLFWDCCPDLLCIGLHTDTRHGAGSLKSHTRPDRAPGCQMEQKSGVPKVFCI